MTLEQAAARLEELQAQRAARLDPMDMPATTTLRERTAYATETAALDHRLVTARTAITTLAALDDAADRQWLDALESWRKQLCLELMSLERPIRDRHTLGVQKNLTLSIRIIDHGTDRALQDSGYDLVTLRLGELMRDSGYGVVGADAARNFIGRMPWSGSIRETERRLKDLARRRAQAQQQLDSALLDDDERAKREAKATALREAGNRLIVNIASDGSCLVAYRDRASFIADRPLALSEMTPLEREAFEQMDAAYRTPAPQADDEPTEPTSAEPPPVGELRTVESSTAELRTAATRTSS